MTKPQPKPAPAAFATDERRLGQLAEQAWNVATVRDWRKFTGATSDAVNPMLDVVRQAYALGLSRRLPRVPKPTPPPRVKRLYFKADTNIVMISPPFNAQAAEENRVEDVFMKSGTFLRYYRVEAHPEDEHKALNVYLVDGRLTTVYLTDIDYDERQP